MIRPGAESSGAIAEESPPRQAATILFVCTGNICRSPLAEVVARQELVDHFGVADLTSVGVEVASAGIAAQSGSPPTREVQQVAREIGIDPSGHRAMQLHPTLFAKPPALVYAMEELHVRWVRSRLSWPVRLLRPGGVDDPYGRSLAQYRRTRNDIVEAVGNRLPEMIAVVSLG